MIILSQLIQSCHSCLSSCSHFVKNHKFPLCSWIEESFTIFKLSDISVAWKLFSTAAAELNLILLIFTAIYNCCWYSLRSPTTCRGCDIRIIFPKKYSYENACFAQYIVVEVSSEATMHQCSPSQPIPTLHPLVTLSHCHSRRTSRTVRVLLLKTAHHGSLHLSTIVNATVHVCCPV